MDDYNVDSLHDSKNEFSARLLNLLTPHIIQGVSSIFNESCKLCNDNNEEEKYLMNFQNFLERIPKWNDTIIEDEVKRIKGTSGCQYLEDLISCVHIIQLKILTSVRVCQKQKKIDINIPNLNKFIHNVYINCARKIYKNIFLYELDIPALQIQKNNREVELIIRECIMNTIRDSIPVDEILRIYMNEKTEEELEDEVVVKEPADGSNPMDVSNNPVDVSNNSGLNNDVESNKIVLPNAAQERSSAKPLTLEPKSPVNNIPIVVDKPDVVVSEPLNQGIKFNDIDKKVDLFGMEELVNAPKTPDRLEKVALENEKKSMQYDDDDDEKLTISTEPLSLDVIDIHSLDEKKEDIKLDVMELPEIEVLE